MISEKRPRDYALQIINSPDTESKRKIFQTVPERFRAIVIHYVQDYERKGKNKRGK